MTFHIFINSFTSLDGKFNQCKEEVVLCEIHTKPTYISSFSTFVNTYAIALGLWPIYVPCLLEQSLIMLLTVMKYVYDKKEARKKMMLKEDGPTHHSEMATTIKAPEEDVFDEEAATASNI